MILLDLFTFIGHLHPVLVHLPIGFLLFAILLDGMSYLQKFQPVAASKKMVLVFGAMASVVSAITGYLLSLSGEYNVQVLNNHQVAGLSVIVVTMALLLITTEQFQNRFQPGRRTVSVIFMTLFLLLVYTGHQGGSLTHGSDYLAFSLITEKEFPKPAALEEALVYEHVIQPMLSRRCSQCHRADKRKGKLSMQSMETLLKGGKSGPAVVSGNLSESELYRRITLDPDHEKFMPAEGKTPLTKGEVAIIKWWIENGLPAEGMKWVELKNSAAIMPQVATFLGMGSPNDEGGLSEETIEPVNPEIPLTTSLPAIDSLRKLGVNVRVMLHQPVMLDVTLPSKSGIKMDQIKPGLSAIAKNVIWLNLSDNELRDNDLSILASFTNLEKLRLEKNPLTDGITGYLAGLTYLEVVNLNETGVTQNCLDQLKNLPRLKRAYHWKTPIKTSETVYHP